MQKYRVLSSFLPASDKKQLVVLTGTRHMGRPFQKAVHLNKMGTVIQPAFLNALFSLVPVDKKTLKQV